MTKATLLANGTHVAQEEVPDAMPGLFYEKDGANGFRKSERAIV